MGRASSAFPCPSRTASALCVCVFVVVCKKVVVVYGGRSIAASATFHPKHTNRTGRRGRGSAGRRGAAAGCRVRLARTRAGPGSRGAARGRSPAPCWNEFIGRRWCGGRWVGGEDGKTETVEWRGRHTHVDNNKPTIPRPSNRPYIPARHLGLAVHVQLHARVRQVQL